MNNKNIKSGNWFIDQLNLYQSANSDYKSIKNNFIIRESEFKNITSSLINKKAEDPLQHELILGRRGSGKSTLLKRIEIEITENPKLNKKFIPINLAEEQAGIYRLFDLWEQVIEEIKHQLKIDLNLKEFSSFDSNDDYTNYLYQVINELCKKHKKRIVLLLDNFDRIVENFTDDGNLLRETLINYNDVEIIAGSTRMDEHFWRYDMPFYEFFRRHRLEALSKDEIYKLLNHWSDSLEIPELKNYVNNHPGKIENIRILTDGLPRTLQFFIQMVLQNADSNSYDYLKKIMDNVTPLYQERLNNLPAQLRKTVLEMAFIWEACTTKQLVEKVKMESKLISANLKTLVEKGIVDKIETNKKNHLYRISERFFNMWLIITQGNPEQKRKAKWLSVFLENWYDANDLKELARKHIDDLKNGTTNWNKALVFSKGLSQSKYISVDERDEIIQLTDGIKDKSIKDCMIELPKKFKDIYLEIEKLIDSDQFDKAIEKINTIENEEDGIKFFLLAEAYNSLGKFKDAEKYYRLSVSKGYQRSNFDLALLLDDQEKFEEAEKYYLQCLDQKDGYKAMTNLALIYYKLGNSVDSIRFLELAIQKGSVYAMFNLGLLYDNEGNYDEAEKKYLLAIENSDLSALLNLGILYQNIGKIEKATQYYQLAIANNLHKALFALGIMYDELGNYAEAERYYLKAIENEIFSAFNNLAVLYDNKGNYKKAEKYYLLAFENGDVEAMNNLGLFYAERTNYKKAEEFYLLAIENNNADSLNNLAYLYYQRNTKNEEALDLIYRALRIEEEDVVFKGTQLTIEIWNGIFNNVEERTSAIIKEQNGENVDEFLFDLLVQQQKSLVLGLFENKEFGIMLQEKYAVLYYVTLLLNDHKEENLLLRIPPELKTTIDEVMTKISEKEVFYGYK